jgi:hypothetical protein
MANEFWLSDRQWLLQIHLVEQIEVEVRQIAQVTKVAGAFSSDP